MSGRTDVHAHLIPGVDDGCADASESIACARMLVASGYTRAFCTPHIWPGFPDNTAEAVVRWTRELQQKLDGAKVPLCLMPGGEINLPSMWPALAEMPPEQIPTYGMWGRHVLVDFWAEELPPGFDSGLRYLQSLGLTVILAHPERISAFHQEPALIDRIQDRGVLLQGNLQCFSDLPQSVTRALAEHYLLKGRYFMLGSDCHRLETLPIRLKGLQAVTALVGSARLEELTVTNPGKLIPPGVLSGAAP